MSGPRPAASPGPPPAEYPPWECPNHPGTWILKGVCIACTRSAELADAAAVADSPPAPPAATPPVTPLDTALERVREALQFLGERNRYHDALVVIEALLTPPCTSTGAVEAHGIAAKALGGDHA